MPCGSGPANHLAPLLKPGDIVIWDNLGIHQDVEVGIHIRASGARLEFLPTYSPDLNPIENALSKAKARMRASAASTNASWWVDPDTANAWTRELDASSCRVSDEHSLGAVHTLMGVWRDPSVRDRARAPLANLILVGLPSVDAVVFEHLAHDELSGDEASLQLLSAIAARPLPFPHQQAADIVEWLSVLVQACPGLVCQVLKKLLSDASAEGEGSSRLFAAAQHLVNITLTLQRIPDFREAGLSMFEQLLDLGVYGTREALVEIDFARR